MAEVSPLRNSFLFLFIAGVLVVLATRSPAYSEQIVIDSVGQFGFAHALMEKGEYERAVAEFERFIHFFPGDRNSPKARFLIGVCYLKDRRFEQARDVFFNIVNAESDGPLSGQALLLIGESYYQQGLFEEAEHYFSQIIEKYEHVDFKNHAAYRLAWTMMKEGRWQDASRIFSRVEKESFFYDSSIKLAEQCLEGGGLPNKRPLYAGILAGLVPGMGHAYVGRYRDSSVAFILNGFFIWAAIESFHKDHYALGSILTVLEAGWYTGNIYSAVNGAHKYNRKVRDDFMGTLTDRFDVGLFASGNNAMGLSLTLRF
jgi:outer membrane protein assembly factor BamD (BamD/ComL family)